MDQTPPDGASIDELRAHIDQLREEARQPTRVEQALATAQERLRRRDQQLSMVEESARALRVATDLEGIVDTAARHVIRAMPADIALVALRPRPAGEVLVAIARADQDELQTRTLDPSSLGIFAVMASDASALPGPQMLFAGQEHNESAVQELVVQALQAHGAAADTDVAHTLLLPLYRPGDRPHGVLLGLDLATASRTDEDRATARDMLLFSTFAAHVEQALDAHAHQREMETAIAEHTASMKQQIEALENELKARDRIQAQLIAARDGAEERAQAKANFLASMSHEIRTPLNGIVGTVELLRVETMSRSQRQRLDVLRSCVSSLQTLVGDILDFSRIEAGYLSLDVRPFLLGDVIEGTYQSLQFHRRPARVGFEVVIGDGVPDVVVGDPDRLGQVLGNLCDNALKFTSQGQVTLRIRVSERSAAAYAEDVTIRFEVEDTGIGMAPDQLERVFQPFRQAEPTTSRTYGGTGLGLAICKQLVEAMGGAIGVTSTLGIGSRFWFTLPLETASEKDLRESSKEHQIPEATQVAPQILLVDDNLINQKVAASLLERLGCHTQVANNGIEAVATARTRPFDLIFMDCQMPHMDGYQAATEIRRIPSHATTPIIALTAYASQDDRMRCLECGMNDYVAKPVTAKRLRDILVRWAGADQPAAPR